MLLQAQSVTSLGDVSRSGVVPARHWSRGSEGGAEVCPLLPPELRLTAGRLRPTRTLTGLFPSPKLHPPNTLWSSKNWGLV